MGGAQSVTEGDINVENIFADIKERTANVKRHRIRLSEDQLSLSDIFGFLDSCEQYFKAETKKGEGRLGS